VIEGLLVVDKQAGMTSHDVVQAVRHRFGQKRVGHGGTLDPDATGVLLVALGRSTRLLRFMADGDKVYEGELVLGVSTTTLDSSGEVVATWDMSKVGDDEIEAARMSLVGRIEQVPPMVSARRVGGVRLHELARRGVEVERSPSEVTVREFSLRRSGDGNAAHPVLSFRVTCSGGTYVRTLADDLGKKLGGGAHLRSLRRIRVGAFGVEEAKEVDSLCEADVLSVGEALRSLQRYVLTDEAADKVRHGRPLDREELGTDDPGPFFLVDAAGSPLAVYERSPDGARAAVVIAK